MEANRMTNANVSSASGAGLKKIGHRFEKGHPHYPPKHPLNQSEYERLKKKFIRELKKEYGDDGDLTFRQTAHINSVAGIMARLQLEGKDIDHANYFELNRELRHGLDALNE
jgi:hypothetical protein